MSNNSAIYIGDPSLIGSKKFSQIDGMINYQSLSDGIEASGISVELSTTRIEMKFMPQPQIAEHLNGFQNYAKTRITKNNDRLIYALTRIEAVRFVIGCEIKPSFDSQGSALKFLRSFVSETNGLLFLNATLEDYDQEVIF